MRTDLRPLEEEIARTKRELNELFREESLASRRGDAAEARERHVSLLRKELENVRTISRYVETISPPVGRDLARWHAQMEIRFEQLRRSGSDRALQDWVARELVPHLRRSEQVAHLVATTVRASPRKAAAPFGWPVAVDRAIERAKRAGPGSQGPGSG